MRMGTLVHSFLWGSWLAAPRSLLGSDHSLQAQEARRGSRPRSCSLRYRSAMSMLRALRVLAQSRFRLRFLAAAALAFAASTVFAFFPAAAAAAASCAAAPAVSAAPLLTAFAPPLAVSGISLHMRAENITERPRRTPAVLWICTLNSHNCRKRHISKRW